MASPIGKVLRDARKQRGFVQRQVADAAGVTIQAVGQWERGDNEIAMENLRQVAAFLRIDAVAASRGELRMFDGDEPANEVQRVSDVGIPDLGPRDVEVLGVIVGGEDEDFRFNGEVIDTVRRPPGIANLRNVFAVHVLGSSMYPRFEPGDLLYCGGREPVPGDDVVIERRPSRERPAGGGYIKRLQRRSASTLECTQFNPEKVLTFDTRDLKAVHRVIPLKELLGF